MGIALAVLLVVIAFASMMMGAYSMEPAQVMRLIAAWARGDLAAQDPRSVTVLFSIQLPRIALAVLVGASLSVSGAVYQGIFRNPMVSPDILGVSNAASVGVAIGLLLGWPTLMVHAVSFAFGIAAVLLVLAIAHAVGGRSGNTTIVMILSGVVIGSMCSAVLSLIKYVADPDNVLSAITYWLMGSFSRANNLANMTVMFAIFLLGAGTLMLPRWKLNAMTFGEEEARTLGVDVKRTRVVGVVRGHEHAHALLRQASHLPQHQLLVAEI